MVPPADSFYRMGTQRQSEAVESRLALEGRWALEGGVLQRKRWKACRLCLFKSCDALLPVARHSGWIN